jgi:hypothetical protein
MHTYIYILISIYIYIYLEKKALKNFFLKVFEKKLPFLSISGIFFLVYLRKAYIQNSTKHLLCTRMFQFCSFKQVQKRVRHPVFPGGLPSKYYPGPMVLDLADLTGCRIFTMVWSYPPGSPRTITI